MTAKDYAVVSHGPKTETERIMACVNGCRGLNPEHIPALLVQVAAVLATARTGHDFSPKLYLDLATAHKAVMGEDSP